MSARKLTDADKVDIIKLYRETDETTSTLAQRYDVSHSTISRFLKSTLSPAEYEVLIQQKRSGRTQKETFEPRPTAPEVAIPAAVPASVYPAEEEPYPDLDLPSMPRLRRRRSSAATETPSELPAVEIPIAYAPPVEAASLEAAKAGNNLLDEANYREQANAFGEILGEDILEIQADLRDIRDLERDLEDDDEDDELDDEDDELEDDELDDLEVESLIPKRRIRSGVLVQVLPLSEASLPKICYLVVDRAAELIARPLKDFGDLGQIPQEEVLEKTLPVFDNHRVARRFSNRTQRVIKVPDGRMLQKASPYLQAKGITRLLIDGQVYSLSTT
jgi:transposase-like protein